MVRSMVTGFTVTENDTRNQKIQVKLNKKLTLISKKKKTRRMDYLHVVG